MSIIETMLLCTVGAGVAFAARCSGLFCLAFISRDNCFWQKKSVLRLPIVGWGSPPLLVAITVYECILFILLMWLYYWEVHLNGLAPQVIGSTSMSHAHTVFFVHALFVLISATVAFTDYHTQTLAGGLVNWGIVISLATALAYPQVLMPVWRNYSSPLVTWQSLDWFRWLKFGSRPVLYSKAATATLSLTALSFIVVDLDRIASTYLRYDRTRCLRAVLAILRTSFLPEQPFLIAMWLFVLFLALLQTGESLHAYQTMIVSMLLVVGGMFLLAFLVTMYKKQQAFGSGDLLLLAYTAAILGWPASIATLLLAALLGLAYGGVKYLFTKSNQFAFAPCLVLASFLVLFSWPVFWNSYLWLNKHWGLI